MAELELKGLHPDGEHLVLAGPDGHRHRLPIDDALRSAVRQDRPRREPARTGGELRPRDIQSRLRAGESPSEIALDAGVTVDHVRRYESPVLAEQAWVAQQGRAMPIGREAGAPVLGDLVVDRLARRGVEPEDLEWSAVRRQGEDWELVLRFHAGERDRVARWRVDLAGRVLHALDDEGRWLSETDLGGGESRRHLAAVARQGGDTRSRVYDVELDALTSGVSAIAVEATALDAPAAEDAPRRSPGLDSATAEILEGLRASRGIRQEMARLDEGDLAADGEEPPAAHPPAGPGRPRFDASALPLRAVPPTPVGGARREDSVGGARREDSSVRDATGPAPAGEEARVGPTRPGSASASRQRRGQQHTEPVPPPLNDASDVVTTDDAGAPPQRRSKPRSRRTSVPSWDEIVFGAKPE